jgi:hypothetical protein
MLSFNMLSDIMLNVIILGVVIRSVMAPCEYDSWPVLFRKISFFVQRFDLKTFVNSSSMKSEIV